MKSRPALMALKLKVAAHMDNTFPYKNYTLGEIAANLTPSDLVDGVWEMRRRQQVNRDRVAKERAG